VKYFIVEDDQNIVNILRQIITERELGQVIGFALDGTSAVDEIRGQSPEIVLVDLFIPGKNGIQLVEELKHSHPDLSYVMISSVSSKDMIAKAYESGVDYYIQKPINAVEVESVLKKVMDHHKKTLKLKQIKNMFDLNIREEKAVSTTSPGSIVKTILKKIGVLGETGTQDIIDIVTYLVESNRSLAQCTIKEICEHFDANAKSVEQRIRRTAMVGLVNLAHLGIEDYMNDVFVEYSGGLYNFSEVKNEMDYIRGKSNSHGKVSIRKFIEALVFYCEKSQMC